MQARAEEVKPLTGAELLDRCSVAVRMLEGGSGTYEEHWANGFCLAYVLGFGDGMRIGSFKVVVNTVKTNDATAIPDTFGGTEVCAPSDATGEQAVRVVLKYLQGHPQLLHKPAGELVWEALHEAFPCGKAVEALKDRPAYYPLTQSQSQSNRLRLPLRATTRANRPVSTPASTIRISASPRPIVSPWSQNSSSAAIQNAPHTLSQ